MIVVVADASPLIALQQIEQLGLLKALFDEVYVPPAVAREVAPRLTLPSWIRERTLQQPIAREVLRASLGPGESEAISLALEIHADRLIIDERAGRRVAESLGLRVAGVLGVLVLSKQRGLVPAVRPHVDTLLRIDGPVPAPWVGRRRGLTSVDVPEHVRSTRDGAPLREGTQLHPEPPSHGPGGTRT